MIQYTPIRKQIFSLFCNANNTKCQAQSVKHIDFMWIRKSCSCIVVNRIEMHDKHMNAYKIDLIVCFVCKTIGNAYKLVYCVRTGEVDGKII